MRIHLYDRSSHEPGPAQAFWGDHWVRTLIGHAFENLGHTLVDNPYRSDLNFYCWGKAPAKRAVPPGRLNVAWFYSHPELMRGSELAKYAVVFCTSGTWLESERFVRLWDGQVIAKHVPPCSHLFGTADPVLIAPSDDRMVQGKNFVDGCSSVLDGECPDVVFIGNARPSRGGRPVVEFLLAQEDLPFTFGVWGRDWGRAGRRWIARYRDFYRLQDLYYSAKVVLIDHQPDMAAWGFLKHQVLDVIAAGGLPLVDVVNLSILHDIEPVWPVYGDPKHALEQLEFLTGQTPEHLAGLRKQIRAATPERTFLDVARTMIATVENL